MGSRTGKIENDARGTGGTSEKNPDECRVLAQDLAVRQHRAYGGLEEVDGDSGRLCGPRRYVADGPLNDEHDPNGVACGAEPHSFELRASAGRRPPGCRRRSCVCRRRDNEPDGHGHSSDVFHAIQRVLSGAFRALREDARAQCPRKNPMLAVPQGNRRAVSQGARGKFTCTVTNVAGVLYGSATAT